MEEYQKLIINILKASINEKKIMLSGESNIKWDKFINEAKQHKISSLVYSSLDRNSHKYIDNNILNEWRKEILKDNVVQIRFIDNVSRLIKNLNEKGIEVILLKGLVLRNFYSRPEYRTMCDADILVRSNNYLDVKKYLIENGYKCDEDTHPVHQSFIDSSQTLIEVHWKLINHNYFNGYEKKFEEDIWKKSIDFNFYEVNSKTLCNEDFLIYMCLHMAVHAKYKGFGLRQLYDMAIFIKTCKIDWTDFYDRVFLYGISKFTKGIFRLLHEIFEVEIPKGILEDKFIRKQDVELLLENVLLSGVHGKKEEVNGFEDLYEYGNDKQHINSNMKRILKLIFPTREELSDRYKYAKENILFLPIAWIHHAITGIYIKKYGFIKMFRYGRKSLNLLNRRKRIIKTFEL